MADLTTNPMEIAERILNAWALTRLGLFGQDVRCLAHFEGYVPRELSPMPEECKRIVGGIEAVNDPSAATTDLQLAVTALDPIAETAATTFQAVPNASDANAGAMTPAHVVALDTVVQGLADEIARASGEEANRIAKAIASNLLTGVTANADASTLHLAFAGVDPQTGESTSSQIAMPIANNHTPGVMPPELYQVIQDDHALLASVATSGGKWVGQNFGTVAELADWAIPASVNANDWCYVLNDEAHGGACTVYAAAGEPLQMCFSREDSQASVGVATQTTPGTVLSADGSVEGKVLVEPNGGMRVVGWDELKALAATASGTPGPQGPKGDKGDKGPAGTQGPQGNVGPAGAGCGNYTVAELDTGRKWINGKTIYRRCFSGTITVAGSTVASTYLMSGVEKLIACGGFFASGSSYHCSVPGDTGNGTASGVQLAGVVGTLNLCTNTYLNRTADPYEVWVEYTKL